MLTLIACPKPFQGHIGVIQRNAIDSWRHLQPRPEILLVGAEQGVEQVCAEWGLVHIADVERNASGTPLVSSIFKLGQERACYPINCYINSDIIMLNDFVSGVEAIAGRWSKYLMVGQRSDVNLDDAWDFDASDSEAKLRALVASEGVLHPSYAIDYFTFPRGMYNEIPPFAIGRLVWDTWLVWRAWADGVPIVDVTQAVTVVHQNHGYDPAKIDIVGPKGRRARSGKSNLKPDEVIWDGHVVRLGPEAKQNIALAQGERNLNIWAAAWMLDSRGRFRKRILNPSLPYLVYQLKVMVPLYWPVFAPLIRWMRRTWRAR